MAGVNSDMRLRGRYAPSPSGLIHLGNARTALLAWLSVRSRGGAFIWRLEDLDVPRVAAGMAAAALEDLRWLGLDWDEGPDCGGPHAPYCQSQRRELYEEALACLAAAGRLFPCRLSRKDLRGLASAPHGTGRALPPYPASLRPRDLPPDWYEALQAGNATPASIRFIVDASAAVCEATPLAGVVVEDLLQEPFSECVAETVGDFVLKRRDGVYAYHLAVVVDDIAMGINQVVRGRDLLDSTARQMLLIRALGAPLPQYAHVPLLLDERGGKLSKRDGVPSLRELREAGIAAEKITGYLAYSAGLMDEPHGCTPEELLGDFDWQRVARQDSVLPQNLLEILRTLR